MIPLIGLILLLAITAKIFKPDLLALKGRRVESLVLDSCALIDGRILDMAQGGFMTQRLIVPDFVIHELQLLADGADAHKRERARFGLNVIKDLQALSPPSSASQSEVMVDHSQLDAHLVIDDKLVALCKKLSAQLYTTDFNLQKVAEIAKIKVLNVNDLAQKLRPIALPGERKTIKILQKGNTPQQGIGYLEDGTMVVIENGARHRGKTVEVKVTRTHQTVSGKMMFAELAARPADQLKVAPEPRLPKFRSRSIAATTPLTLKRPSKSSQ